MVSVPSNEWFAYTVNCVVANNPYEILFVNPRNGKKFETTVISLQVAGNAIQYTFQPSGEWVTVAANIIRDLLAKSSDRIWIRSATAGATVQVIAW